MVDWGVVCLLAAYCGSNKSVSAGNGKAIKDAYT